MSVPVLVAQAVRPHDEANNPKVGWMLPVPSGRKGLSLHGVLVAALPAVVGGRVHYVSASPKVFRLSRGSLPTMKERDARGWKVLAAILLASDN